MEQTSFLKRTFMSLSLYPNYRLIWLGSLSEHIGEWMELTALLWLMNQLTDSPFLTTLMSTLRFLPMIVFAYIGGIVADRVNRRMLLICCLLFSAAMSIALSVIVHLGAIQPWQLLVYSVLSGIATSFNHPARQTMLPNVVNREHYLNAIVLDNGTVTASRVMGAPLAGVIIAMSGSTAVLGLRALGALVAVFWLSRIKANLNPGQGSRKHPWRSLVEGIRYVNENKPVMTQVLLYLIPFFVTNSYTALLPYFATRILRVGPELYGIMNAAPGAGALMATFVLASFTSLRRRGLILLLGGIVQGLGLVLFGFSPYYLVSVVLLLVLGASNEVFMALNNTLIQETITDEVRGRVMSLREVCFGLGPAGSLVSGALAGSMGGPFALLIAGGISIAILSSVLTMIPQARQRA